MPINSMRLTYATIHLLIFMTPGGFPCRHFNNSTPNTPYISRTAIMDTKYQFKGYKKDGNAEESGPGSCSEFAIIISMLGIN
jgi:hypothetical protein